MTTHRRVFGLMTAISMIVGIVIGSGIFFKADDILLATGGNIALGFILLCLGAAALIFGALSFTIYAVRCSGEGGLMSYYEDFISPGVAAGFGFFQGFVYMPTLLAVVAWVCVFYIERLFGWQLNLLAECFGALILILVLLLINLLSRKLGAFCQRASTFIKLIPLVLIAGFGLFYAGDPIGPSLIPPGEHMISTHAIGFTWLASLAPIAYAFDGWSMSLNITPEVRQPHKTMPRALIIGPLIVLATYLLYFGGLVRMLGAEAIMTLGDASLDRAVAQLIHPFFAKILLVFIIIAILGVCNGIMMAGIRMPQVLSADSGILPKAIGQIHPKLDLSIRAAGLFFGITLFWLSVHYLCQSTGILNGRDITEIAIVFSYLIYCILYVRIIGLYRKGLVKSFFKGIVCPILAIIGAVALWIGGMISSPLFVALDILICLIVFLAGWYWFNRCQKRQKRL